jgi:two-component system, chemotaxis family, protein-glutamate methylesterase/glutaminase
MPLPAVPPIRVLVVEDSARLRARIIDVLSADPAIVVVAQAADGRAAIDLCRELRPDVVTMGLLLPVVSGLAATEQLMQCCPTPILIIAAATGPGEPVNAIAALAAGAVDVLEKPRTATAGEAGWNHRLVSTVKLVARIQVITHLSRGTERGPAALAKSAAASSSTRTRESVASVPIPAARQPIAAAGRQIPPTRAPIPAAGVALPTNRVPMTPARRAEAGAFSVVAIGASTGGPAAVSAVLSGLPEAFPLPILLVLHVSDSFGPAIVSWLSGVTGLPVRLADHGEPLSMLGGQVIMAPPGLHLAVSHGLLRLNRDPERHSCRPSVDVLFESLAEDFGPRVAACLLTGMGKDGASGLLKVHNSGGTTIAQDEATSVVFGMPGEAVRLGAAQHVLPVAQIGPLLGRLAAAEVGPR